MCQQVMESGNASVVLSTLIFSPVPDDHGKILKCRGENPALADAYLEDFFKLNVVCKWRASFLRRYFYHGKSDLSYREINLLPITSR